MRVRLVILLAVAGVLLAASLASAFFGPEDDPLVQDVIVILTAAAEGQDIAPMLAELSDQYCRCPEDDTEIVTAPTVTGRTSSEVVAAFKEAGLTVLDPRPMTKSDYGLAPAIGKEGTQFEMSTEGLARTASLISFETKSDLNRVKAVYEGLGEFSAIAAQWVFEDGNILFVANAMLPEDVARAYEAVLHGEKPILAPTPEINLEVAAGLIYPPTSSRWHTDAYGEAINKSDVPLQNAEVIMSLLDENGDIVTVDTYRSMVDFVPVNGKFPFHAQFFVPEEDWTDFEFLVQAEPYDEDHFQGKLPLSLKTEGARFSEDTMLYMVHLGGRVINQGDRRVGRVQLIGIAYDESHRVVDIASGDASLDYIEPGGYSPFDLEFKNINEKPFDFDILVQGKEVD